MSDILSVEPTLRVHFGLERKRNLGNYEHTVASANVSSDISASADQSEIIAKIASLAAAVKLAVLNELGIEATFAPDGTVVEAAPAVAAQLTVAEAKAKLEQAFSVDPNEVEPPGLGSGTAGWGNVPADVVADWLANPSNYYDNRASKTPGSKGPDLKRKSDGKGFWIVSKF